MITIDLAYTITLRILGGATIISSLELLYLVRRQEFASRGTWDWSIIGVATSPRSNMVDPLFKHPGAIGILLLLRLVGGVSCLMLPWGSLITVATVLCLLLIQVALNMRIVFGDDGSDQMLSVTLGAVSLGGLSTGNATAETICLVFLAIQGTLSYSCSGIAKCFGGYWRDGSALTRVLGHHAYGHQSLHAILSSYKIVGRVATWGVVAFQVTFVLFWLTPEPWNLIWLASGLGFHLAIAYAMRLNGFLFAFPCSYPAMIYVHSVIWVG